VRKREKAKHLWPLPYTDILEYENSVPSISKLISGSNLIINLVGVLQSKIGKPWGVEFENAHVQLISNLVNAAEQSGCQNIIHISALGSSKNAPSMYLRSKAEGEKILYDSSLNTTILRPSVVFGPGDKFLTMFAKMHKFLPCIPLASYSSLFQPIYVGDLIRIIQLCIENKSESYKTYDCVGPEVFTLGELVKLAGTLSKRKKLVFPLPDFIARTQAFLMEKIPGPTILSRDNLDSASIPNIAQNPREIFSLSNLTDIKSVASEYLRG
jgi:NADH dehydrogenase